MRFLPLLCLFILTACGKKEKVPDGIMPVPQMTNVLWDLMLADEMVALKYPVDTGNIRFDTSLVLYSQVAKAHNTTQKQFQQSLQFYKKRPDLMQVIIDSLTARTVLPVVTSKDSVTKDSSRRDTLKAL